MRSDWVGARGGGVRSVCVYGRQNRERERCAECNNKKRKKKKRYTPRRDPLLYSTPAHVAHVDRLNRQRGVHGRA